MRDIPAMSAAITNIGNDSARVQFRQNLATYFHAQEMPAPTGYAPWTSPHLEGVSGAAKTSPKLLVGDPVTLLVSPSRY